MKISFPGGQRNTSTFFWGKIKYNTNESIQQQKKDQCGHTQQHNHTTTQQLNNTTTQPHNNTTTQPHNNTTTHGLQIHKSTVVLPNK